MSVGILKSQNGREFREEGLVVLAEWRVFFSFNGCRTIVDALWTGIFCCVDIFSCLERRFWNGTGSEDRPSDEVGSLCRYCFTSIVFTVTQYKNKSKTIQWINNKSRNYDVKGNNWLIPVRWSFSRSSNYPCDLFFAGVNGKAMFGVHQVGIVLVSVVNIWHYKGK